MGSVEEQKSVKLVVSIIFKDEELLGRTEERLRELYGPVEGLDVTLPFDRTDYYYEELGGPLKRKVVCFKNLVPKDGISQIKLMTNRIEDIFRVGGKRAVNIDPGYVTEAKLVLLTTKDYTHRVYVGEKIFAESTLFYQDGEFNSWPWTYPDYASGELSGYFKGVREIYMKDVRESNT